VIVTRRLDHHRRRLVFHGEPDATSWRPRQDREVLWRFRPALARRHPPVVYELDGDQYIAIATRVATK